MIKVFCKTNLDLYNEEWPTEMAACPAIGDEIRSKTVHKGSGFSLTLQVVQVTWIFVPKGIRVPKDGYYPQIELGFTKYHTNLRSSRSAQAGSITAFYEWYAPLVGKTTSYFI